MGQIAKGGKLDLRRPGSKPSPALWPRWGALNQFMSPQATQPIENIDSARENPRKSKSNNRSTGVRFAARPRLADVIQVASRRLKGFAVSTAASLTPHFASQKYAGLDKGANFSPLPPCKPLKTNDRRRFAAENGGRLGDGISAFLVRPRPPGRLSSGRAPAGVSSTNVSGVIGGRSHGEPRRKP
jgi:hypothetical protein